jgi:hypothetical protein
VRQRERVVPVARPSERPPCAQLARQHGAAFSTAEEESGGESEGEGGGEGGGLPRCNAFAKLTYLEQPRRATEATMAQLTALAAQVRCCMMQWCHATCMARDTWCTLHDAVVPRHMHGT